MLSLCCGCTGVLTIDELQKLLRRGTTVELDPSLKPGAAGEIELKVDQAIAAITNAVAISQFRST